MVRGLNVDIFGGKQDGGQKKRTETGDIHKAVDTGCEIVGGGFEDEGADNAEDHGWREGDGVLPWSSTFAEKDGDTAGRLTSQSGEYTRRIKN